MTRLALLLLIAAPLLVSGCQSSEKKPEIRLGVPAGVHLAASDGVPAFDVGLAIDEKTPLDPLVPVLSGAVHQAVAACPSFIKDSAPDESTRVAMLVEQGKIKSTDVFGAHPDPCLREKLNGWAIEGSPPELHVLAEIRFPGVARSNAP